MSETTALPSLCDYFPACNACQLWDLGYSAQKDLKTSRLQALLDSFELPYLGAIDFVSSAEFGLRDRIDFTFKYDVAAEKTIYGFYDRDKRLLSIKKCLQMSAQLQKIYDEFIILDPTAADQRIAKGSVRLRRGVDGLKGCWLDLANLDIKQLLEDGIYLRTLLDRGFKVEMGQKGKSVSVVNGELKLTDPVAYPWFVTTDSRGVEIPLSCLVSDFTQPSWKSSKELVSIVLAWIKQVRSPVTSIAEFGPGIGQFTLPLLSEGISVAALEVDTAACENLRLNSKNHSAHLKILNDDFQRQAYTNTADLILVNPARSGLKKFTESIVSSHAKNLIYISCFPESMCEDLAHLKNSFRIKEIKIVDQFPQTNHFETCVFLEKI